MAKQLLQVKIENAVKFLIEQIGVREQQGHVFPAPAEQDYREMLYELVSLFARMNVQPPPHQEVFDLNSQDVRDTIPDNMVTTGEIRDNQVTGVKD